MSTRRRFLTLPEAAQEVGYSVDTLRRAIHTSDPHAFPPPLRAKRERPATKDKPASGAYRIRSVDLDAWVDSFPDA